MQTDRWDDLIIERRTAPPPLDEPRFRQWLEAQRIFVSSVMDAEMMPARKVVADYLRAHGATPVMWESITPVDRQPEHAYLDGVEQATVFVLILGSRYGRSDSSGYSPTHKEERRAGELGLPRLVFERDGVERSVRDGRLNDWIDSIYNEISGAKFADPDDLVGKLDRQLREMASAQDTYWVKLGPLVFPGSVSRRSSQVDAEFVIRATLRDSKVRRMVTRLTHWQSRVDAHRLTWGTETHAVTVTRVSSNSIGNSADDVEITCEARRDHHDADGMFGGMTVSYGGRSVGPAEQAEIWAREALFGERSDPERRRMSGEILRAIVAHDGPSLPDILRRYETRAWLAEGLSRVFAIEEATAKFGGHFESLDVGPATGTSVRIKGVFRPGGFGSGVSMISGRVPLEQSASQRGSNVRG